jgi:hypothetical protein
MVFVYALSIVFAPRPALAANSCDFNIDTCINECRKANPQRVAVYCPTTCIQTMERRKKKWRCKGYLAPWAPVTD